MATRTPAPALAALVLGVGLGACFNLGACFDAPSAAVMFACEPDEAAACPAGYTCEADGCCHRDGSDVAAHVGECKLGGAATEATGAPATDGGSSSSGGPTGGVSSTTTTGGTSTGSTSTGATSTGGTSTGGETTGGTSTGGTSTGGTSTGGTTGGTTG